MKIKTLKNIIKGLLFLHIAPGTLVLVALNTKKFSPLQSYLEGWLINILVFGILAFIFWLFVYDDNDKKLW